MRRATIEQDDIEIETRSNPKGAWRTLALAFIAQNFAIGLSLGSFSVSVLAIQEEFHTTRAIASLGGSLVVLALGLFGPIAASSIERFTIRKTMLGGVLVGSLGYLALSVAPNIWLFLLAYLILIGPGAVLSGILPASVLINNWFPVGPGRAVGIMMMPLFIMLVPIGSTMVIEATNVRYLYLVLAVTNLLLFPLLWLVKDRPPKEVEAGPEQRPVGADGDALPHLKGAQILGRIDFWLLVLAIGLLNGSGMVKLSHLVPLVAEQGRTVGEATLLLSISGGAGVVGSMIFGWLADRFGGPPALMLNGLVQAAAWTIFFMHPGMPLLILDATLMGICGGGVFAAYMVVIRFVFGSQNMPRALALAGLFGMIPNFVAPPIAGFLQDRAGSYWTMLIAVSTGCLIAALSMAVLWARHYRAAAATRGAHLRHA